MISFILRWILILWVCYKINLESGILISISLAMICVFLEIAFLWLIALTDLLKGLTNAFMLQAKKSKGAPND